MAFILEEHNYNRVSAIGYIRLSIHTSGKGCLDLFLLNYTIGISLCIGQKESKD